MTRPRVVITGLGAITPLGSSINLLWEGLLNGRSGVRRITQFDASSMPCQIAGEIPDFEVDLYIDKKEARRVARSAQIALASAIQAVRDAGLPETMAEPERSGVVFATAIGGLDRIDEGIQILRSIGLTKINPFTLPAGIPNLSSYMIAKQFQCLGQNSTVVTACAAGTQAVGEAAEYIRRGACDLVITGGTEALIRDFSIAGFCAMRALPVNYNQCPEMASRPFDARREGFIFSEGAASLILRVWNMPRHEAHASTLKLPAMPLQPMAITLPLLTRKPPDQPERCAGPLKTRAYPPSRSITSTPMAPQRR